MINPALGFWLIFGPLGPTAGPGSPGNGPGSKNSAGRTNNQPRRPIPKSHSWALGVFGAVRQTPFGWYVPLPSLSDTFLSF